MGAMKGGSLVDKGVVKGPENPHCSELPSLLGEENGREPKQNRTLRHPSPN